jgi:hypothetical protein
MNFTENFQDFSTRLTPLDLMIYGGAGLILFALFGDKLNPVINKLKELYQKKINTNIVQTNTVSNKDTDSLFLELISSWKNTRNLAEQNGCNEATKILDDAFPHLGPHNCKEVLKS